MPKVMYVGHYSFDIDSAAVHRVKVNTTILQKAGFQVVHVSGGSNSILDGVLEGDGCIHYYIKRPDTFASYYSTAVSGKDVIDLIDQEKPNIVVLYNYHMLSMINILRHCRRRDIKVLADVTEWYRYSNILLAISKGLESELKMRFVHKRLDGLFVVSRYLEEYYKSSVPLIIYLPPLIDYSDIKWRFNSNSSEIPEFITIAPNLKHKEDLSRLLEMFRIVNSSDSNFLLHIFGINEVQYCKIYNSIGVDKELRGKVIFHGRVDHEKVLEKEKNSWFLIFYREINLSNLAGFPSKIPESLACGTPVITNSTSNICEYIEDGVNGFILSGDVLQDANRIVKILRLHLDQINEMHKNTYLRKQFDQLDYISEVKKVHRLLY